MFDVGSSPESAGPWLFLDASGLNTCVGVWSGARWLGWRENTAAALEGLFSDTAAVLDEAQIAWPQLQGYIYVEGPGAVLGLRLAAMAIRAWQVDAAARLPSHRARPVWGCGSLQLAAALAQASGIAPPFAICTEARQGLWHLLEITGALTDFSALASREVPLAQLPRGPLFRIPARKTWAGPLPPTQPLPAKLRDHPEILQAPRLLHPVETATPFTGQPHEYKKWTGAKA